MQRRSQTFLILLVLLTVVSTGNAMPLSVRADSTTIIKVMTYNTHHCNPPGKPGVIDVDAVANVVKAQNADIVALQEIDVNTARSGNINQAELLASKTGYKFYFFAKAMDFDSGQYGVLILSKYSLKDTATHALPKAEDPGGRGEPRVVALATVELPGGKSFRFGSTHLEAYNKTSRLLQAKDINSIASSTTLPFIIAGDFNARENSDVINTIDEHFIRTCTNCAGTFVGKRDEGAIDYIAASPRSTIEVLSHSVVPDKETSDHMPVVVTLKLK